MWSDADRCARRRKCTALALALLFFASVAQAADGPLHQRIDAALESSYFGPLAEPASDAEFLRRVSLDLNGLIPTASDTRAFLEDKSENKRAAVIDRLLATPEYARNLSTVLDVMLTERLADKVVKRPNWTAYLHQSVLENKPWNQLAKEILSAECKEALEQAPPATKFYLDRDVEANQVTRDIGRIFFGMDMQCAQCHNHPIVDDYYQSDYYGLLAFVTRTYSFKGGPKNSALAIGEKPDGDTNFKSVFTGFAMDKVPPRLPKGAVVAEPVVAKGEEYVVPPGKDKTILPVPKVSRRGLLGDAAASGASATFNRNIVNRLWAHMFGIGLVHPVDMHHSDNPPSHPALLAMLADEFVAMKFDMKAFLRELALTKAYQRSCDLPSSEVARKIDAAPHLSKLTEERDRLAAAKTASTELVAKLTAELAAAREAAVAAKPDAAKLKAEQTAAKDASTKAAAELAAAQKELTAKQEAAQALSDTIAKAKIAVQKLAGDAVLAEAVKQIEERSKAVAAEVAASQKLFAEREAAAKNTAATLARLEGPSEAEEKARQKVLELDTALAAAQAQSAADRMLAGSAESQLSEAQDLAEFQRLAAAAEKSKAAGDLAAAETQWNKLTERWNRRFAWMALKPLSPEQLAWGVLRATGEVDAQRTVVENELTTKPPKGLNMAEPKQKAMAMEKGVYDKLLSSVNGFVAAFSNGPGQPPEVFAPSVTQALYVSNSGPMQSYLGPGANNLTARLNKINEADKLADEMYMNVLSRLPLDEERTEVSTFLSGRDSDRLAAIQEMLWGLLTSSEFRFNH